MIPLFVYAASPWDAYLIGPNSAAWRPWFQSRAAAISGWSPWQSPTIQWFTGPVGAYIDTYAIYPPGPNGVVTQTDPHPELTFKDAAGNLLYIPWGCSGGTCPQYAGDFANQAFYNYQGTGMASIRKAGFNMFFLDDVNLDVRSSDGNGAIVLPQYFTPVTWAEKITVFVEKIRADYGVKIVHNSIWFSSAPQDIIDREIKAADWINCERGFGDGNLNPQSFLQFLDFIDHVHSLGRSVIQDENDHTNLSFKIACFLLAYKPGDLMCVNDLFPDNWDPQMDVDFGVAVGPRYSQTAPDGTVTWNRVFTKVTVAVNFSTRIGVVTPR